MIEDIDFNQESLQGFKEFKSSGFMPESDTALN
jgi:hypothetical protein